jgi:peptidyl-prolyl cis-trans isomerase D
MAKPTKNKKIKTKKHLAREQREAKQIRIIVIITVVVAVIVISLILYGTISQLVLRPKKLVAKVDDTTITVGQMDSRVKYTRIQMLNQAYNYYQMYEIYSMYSADYATTYLNYAQSYVYQLLNYQALGTDVVDEMINEIIIRKEAAARGITVSDEEVELALREAFDFYPEGTYTPSATATILSTPTYSETQLSLVTLTSTPSATLPPTETPEVTNTPSEEGTDGEKASSEEVEETPTPELSPTITLTPTITPTPTTYTTQIFAGDLKEFDENYKNYDFDIDDYREVIEIQLLKDKLLEVITQDLVPVQDEVWARHILVETEAEAKLVHKLLQAGIDFHDVAAEYSLDTTNNKNGGDLGWFDEETMVQEFTDVAFSLEVGEISEPFETSYGFHIIQVLGKRENQTPVDDFEEDKQEAFANWLSEVRAADYEVTLYEGWEEFIPDYPVVNESFLEALQMNF